MPLTITPNNLKLSSTSQIWPRLPIIASDLQITACADELHSLLGEAVDFKGDQLLVAAGFSRVEREWYVHWLAGRDDTSFKTVMKLGSGLVQAVHAVQIKTA